MDTEAALATFQKVIEATPELFLVVQSKQTNTILKRYNTTKMYAQFLIF